MKKVVSVYVAVMMLLQVSFGYTLTVSNGSTTMTREFNQGTRVTLGLSNRVPARFTVVKGNVSLEELETRRQFTMPAEEVEIRIEEIKTVADMEVGDYVTYYPLETAVDLTSLTGFTHETLNPSLTTEWRVLSKDAEKVELISADSVGTLTLSQESIQDAGGNFTTGSQEIMDQSKENYANCVWILDRISRAYANPRITNGWRGLGYNGTTTKRIDTTTYAISHEATGGMQEFVEGEPYSDSKLQYATDVDVLIDNDILHSSGDVWLASRYWDTYSDGTAYSSFSVRFMALTGYGFYSLLFDYSGDSAISYARTCGIRPVISLKLDTEITGSGTVEDKWVVPNPSSYTMADMRVGDYVKYYPEENTVDLTALTGFEHEALNTADTEDWRVLSVDESTGEVELVSADSVTTLTLSQKAKKNTSGVFTIGSEEIMEQSKINYANAIYILNEISRAYEKDGITKGSRGLMYNGKSIEKIDTDDYEISHEATGGNENFVSGEPYIESYYVSDINALKNNEMLIESAVWLASRSWGTHSSSGVTFSNFGVRAVNTLGNTTFNGLFGDYSDGSALSELCSSGVRPIISLQLGLPVNGAGTTSNPWVFGQ